VGQVGNLRPIVNRPAASCHAYFVWGDAAMWAGWQTARRFRTAAVTV